MNTSRFALWWHNIWRNENKSNVALCVVCLLIVVIVWVFLTLVSGAAWNATLNSLLKIGNPGGVPVGVHFLLGLIGSVVIMPFVFAMITVWIRRRAQKVQLGQKRYKWIRNHIVIIGYTPYSASIIINLMQKEENATSPLIILTMQPPKTLRAELRSLLPKAIEERIIIYAGSPVAEGHIKQLNLHLATAVYVTLEGKEWDSAYARALSTLPSLAKYALPRTNLLPVNLLINDDKAYENSQSLNIPESFKQHDGVQTLDVHIYNVYENWARLLWSYDGLKNKNGDYVYDALDFESLENTDKYVHLVIVAFNNMGKALLNEAIRVCHYVNFDAKTGRGKTRITVIDPKAESYQRNYRASYPFIAQQVKDIDIAFVPATVEDEAVRAQLREWATDEQQLLTVAICIGNPDIAMQAALNLPEEVFFTYANGTLKHRSRVLVRQTVRSGIQELFDANSEHYAHLKTFGMYYEGANIDLLNDDVEICVNGLYSEQYYDNIDQIDRIEQLNVLEKFPAWQQLWYQTSEMNRQKTRYQIDMHRSFFAYMHRKGIPMGHILTDQTLIEQLAEVEHRRWNALISLLNYRQAKPTEKRMDAVKIHNCIMDYDQLTRPEQLKDHVVIITAPILCAWEKQLHQ